MVFFDKLIPFGFDSPGFAVYGRVDAVVVITLLSIDLAFLACVISASANERYQRPATYVLATYNVGQVFV